MLLELAAWLKGSYSFFNLFQYLTVRTIASALTALGATLLLGPPVIRKLAELKAGQVIRHDGPQTHLAKAGTPTMGGALILAAIFIATLLWADLRNTYVWVVLFGQRHGLLAVLGFGHDFQLGPHLAEAGTQLFAHQAFVIGNQGTGHVQTPSIRSVGVVYCGFTSSARAG